MAVVRGANTFGASPAGVRLVAFLLLCALVWSAGVPAPRVLAAGCSGDERLLLAPTDPYVGAVLIVAAISKAPHEHVLLLGPDGPLVTQREAINDLYMWKATLVPGIAGEQLFAFGVVDGAAEMTSCAEAVVAVSDGAATHPPDVPPSDAAAGAGDVPPAATPTASDSAFAASVLFASLHPWTTDATISNGQPAAVAPPPTPAADPGGVAPTPDSGRQASAPASDTSRSSHSSSRSRSGNGNENDNDAEPTPTRTPTSTRTPTPTKTPTLRPTATPTLAPPGISSISPDIGTCGQVLTIRGQRFGETRDDVDGTVRVDGREASIVSWSMSEVSARLALSTRGGPERLLEVIVAEKVATRTLRISC